MNPQADYIFSSYREQLLEHLFVGALLQHLWIRGVHQVDVLHSEVDAAGYDVVIECASIVRHIQLKATGLGGTRANVNLNVKLAEKPSGCVVWLYFEPQTLNLGPFLWFGGDPGCPLPPLTEFRTGRHTKADATGYKAERPNIRLVPKGRFTKLDTVAEVAGCLFTLPEEPRR